MTLAWGALREAQNKAPAFIAHLFCTDNLMFPDLLQDAKHLSFASVQDRFKSKYIKSWYGRLVDFAYSFLKGAGPRAGAGGRRGGGLCWLATLLDTALVSKVCKSGTELILGLKNAKAADEQAVARPPSPGPVLGGGE